jgi:hypothetical protein
MEELKSRFGKDKVLYLIGENTSPLLDLIISNNSITIKEHIENGENCYTRSLRLDEKNSTSQFLVFTTRLESLCSYFLYQVDITVDLKGDGSSPLFNIMSGIPIFSLFNETYTLTVRKS